MIGHAHSRIDLCADRARRTGKPALFRYRGQWCVVRHDTPMAFALLLSDLPPGFGT